MRAWGVARRLPLLLHAARRAAVQSLREARGRGGGRGRDCREGQAALPVAHGVRAGAGLPAPPDVRSRGAGDEDMSTKLKAAGPPEGMAEETKGAEEFTEELPPIHIDPTSSEARMAGVESCSVVREISKHWSTISAFEVEREAQIREREGKPPLSEYEEREGRSELWRRKWEPRPQKEVDELVEYIKRKAVSFVDW